jgi:hypothetical protein
MRGRHSELELPQAGRHHGSEGILQPTERVIRQYHRKYSVLFPGSFVASTSPKVRRSVLPWIGFERFSNPLASTIRTFFFQGCEGFKK